MMPSSPARAEVPRVDSLILALLSTIRLPRAPGDRLYRLPLPTMDVPHGFDPTLILVLNLAGTFIFGLSGGLAAVRGRLDLFGIVVLSAVGGLARGITPDPLIGTPPPTLPDPRSPPAPPAARPGCLFRRPA